MSGRDPAGLAGTRFAGFAVDERIAAPGPAVVYRAHRAAGGEVVALKVVPADAATDAAWEMWAWRAVAMRPHPAVARPTGAGVDEGLRWIATPLLALPSLADLLAAPIRPARRRLLAMLADLAAAVDHLAAEGLVHHDVSPANVRVGPDDHVVLTGVGELPPPHDGATPSGVVVGRLGYLAPEVVRGERPGPGADRYAVATMAYEILTGSLPFPADDPGLAWMLRVVNDPVPSHPALAPALDAALRRGLAKDPAARPATAGELVDALRDALGPPPSPVAAPPPPPVSVLRPGSARPPTPAPVAPPPPAPAPVGAAVFAPAVIPGGGSAALVLWLHEPHLAEAARAAAAAGAPRRAATGEPSPAAGDRVDVVLSVGPALSVAEPHAVVGRLGGILPIAFALQAVGVDALTRCPGEILVTAPGRPLVRLTFDLAVGPAAGAPAAAPGEVPVRRRELRSAFLSYASRDRREVLARAQGIRARLPGLEMFMDVLALRAGERWARELPAAIDRADVLLLFWSRAAARSEWVEREWRHALGAKGLDGIRPVPLEPPERVPPPAELADLHFNDAFLMLR